MPNGAAILGAAILRLAASLGLLVVTYASASAAIIDITTSFDLTTGTFTSSYYQSSTQSISPVTVSDGDTVNVDATFLNGQSLQVHDAFLIFISLGPAFSPPLPPYDTNSSVTFLGLPGTLGPFGAGFNISGNTTLYAQIYNIPPFSIPSFSFNEFQFSVTFTQLPSLDVSNLNFLIEAASNDLEGGIVNGATPLPAALPLFATGLGAIGLLGWRRKRKAKAGA